MTFEVIKREQGITITEVGLYVATRPIQISLPTTPEDAIAELLRKLGHGVYTGFVSYTDRRDNISQTPTLTCDQEVVDTDAA